MWGETKEGNGMQGTGRLQTLLTLDQLRESERWNDEHILPAVAEAWETRGTGDSLRRLGGGGGCSRIRGG